MMTDIIYGGEVIASVEPEKTATLECKGAEMKSNVVVKTGKGITVDSELSTTSENPVQNKVITLQFNAALEGIEQGMGQMEQTIAALYTAMYSALATPASVDMSGFDSGRIVETFADGTTKTTTIEFDAEGNPAKITDGDGRVTTYTW